MSLSSTRVLYKDPLGPRLTGEERRLVARLENAPREILRPDPRDAQIVRELVRRLRRKGFNIQTIYGAGYTWDGLSR